MDNKTKYAKSTSIEIDELYKQLCKNYNNSAPCGNCKYSLMNSHVTNNISFRFLIGLIENILIPTVGTITCPYLTDCYIMCNGKTHTEGKIVDPDFKLLVDIALCKSMVMEWLRTGENTESIVYQVDELLSILDMITTSEHLVLALGSLYMNYDLWHSV